MGATSRPEPTVFVIFGAAGDLSWRKLIPALFSLKVDGWLPEKFRIIGTGHRHMEEEEEFRNHLKAGGDKYARRTLTEEELNNAAISGDVLLSALSPDGPELPHPSHPRESGALD
jgi:glucose-6-phosphate 1-dehydrogenase